MLSLLQNISLTSAEKKKKEQWEDISFEKWL